MNFGLILLASFLQFILGALWYSPLMFGKWWMQIMEVTHLGKEELQKMQKEMLPFYGLQFVLTLVTNFVLYNNLVFNNLSGGAAYGYAFFMWMGYIAPIIVQTVIWGNTKKKYWVKQLFVSLSFQFVAIMLATLILTQ
jgi:hypothetical protein